MENPVETLVLTIGHSTMPLDEFIGILETNGATVVVDIRSVPRSKHNPQFNQDSLPDELGRAGIGYVHIAGLGGFRRQLPGSPNTGWRNVRFRGFADYMQTGEFKDEIEALVNLAKEERPCLMCAEAVPWRCHRSLIADALVVRGVAVEHIIGRTGRRRHVLTPWAKTDGTDITYPAP